MTKPITSTPARPSATRLTTASIASSSTSKNNSPTWYLPSHQPSASAAPHFPNSHQSSISSRCSAWTTPIPKPKSTNSYNAFSASSPRNLSNSSSNPKSTASP